MNAYEPHNWLGVLGLIVIAVGAIIPAWLAASRGKKLKRQTGEVLEQVRNDHTETNLRDDLDRIHADVKEVLVKVVRLETRFDEHLNAHSKTQGLYRK